MEAARQGYRVVIVEDHDDNRELLKVLLEFEGHVVDEAADGEEGLHLIEQVRPDVALIDLGLPGLDGFALAKRIRANDTLDRVGLVALSGYANPGDIEQARSAGFDEHLAKPATPERLLAAVHAVAQGRRA